MRDRSPCKASAPLLASRDVFACTRSLRFFLSLVCVFQSSISPILIILSVLYSLPPSSLSSPPFCFPSTASCGPSLLSFLPLLCSLSGVPSPLSGARCPLSYLPSLLFPSYLSSLVSYVLFSILSPFPSLSFFSLPPPPPPSVSPYHPFSVFLKIGEPYIFRNSFSE